MLFNKADLESLVARSLVIECFEISLVQNAASSPNTFNGPGSISMQANGRLTLKMYDASKKSRMDEMMRFFFQQSPGLVPETEFYALNAKDAHGNIWTSPKIYIRNGLNLTPNGAIVELDLPGIWATKNTKHRVDLEDKDSAEIIVSGKFTLPFNRFEDQSDGSSTVTGLNCEFDDASLNFSQKPTHLEVYVETKPEVLNQNFIVKIFEALSIAIGKEAWPTYYRVYTADAINSFVSGKVDVKGLAMMQPFVDVFPYKPAKFNAFLALYIGGRQKEHDHIINYWRRLYYISSIISDVAALVLTVNIEGMIKNYFSAGRTPSKLILEQIEISENLLKPIKLPTAIESRITNLLGSMKKLSTPNILRQLAGEGIIESAQVTSWNDLRHALAHAANTDSDPATMDAFIKNITNCLELFYRLIGLSVGYDALLVKTEDELISEDLLSDTISGG